MTKPNILIFMTDQQRGDTVLEHTHAKMPNLEKFQKEGLLFSQAHCPAPHCCPSRATFFTGLQPSEHNVWNNVNVSNAISRGLATGVKTWSEDLKENGYDLYFSGKWHVSSTETPENRAWKSAVGEFNTDIFKPYGMWDVYDNYKETYPEHKRKLGEIIRSGYPDYKHYGTNENPFNDLGVVQDGQECLKKISKSNLPWCLYIGTLGPHDPYFPPKRFLDMYPIDEIELPKSFNDDFTDKPNFYKRTKDVFAQLSDYEHKEAIQHYLAFCSYEDWLFGEVLATLEETSKKDNTLVIYLSDHGDYMAEHGLWCKGIPCFKGAYNIPCIMRWPNGIINPGRVIDDFIGLDDFAPTFMDITNTKVNRHFSGKSLLPFLKNKTPENWRDAYYTQTNGNELYGIQRSVTTKEFKFVFNGFDYDELYDLENDPCEMTNIINNPNYANIIKEFYVKLWTFARENNDTCINPYIFTALAQYGPGVGKIK